MQNTIVKNMMLPEYMRHPPAWFYNRVLVGAGAMLTPSFVRKYGITHVINCAGPEDSPSWFRTSYPYNYECIGAQDSLFANILDWYPRFQAILHAFLQHGTGTVFVHCQAGMNRSGFLALAYVCRNFGVPFDTGIANGRRQRPVLFQNPVFMRQVEEFIKHGRISRA